jgi:hypothetical protein
MDKSRIKERTQAQLSTNAIERMYISMLHLFSRGFYKPMGVSGESLRHSLLLLKPEIYGSIAEEKLELNGLVYVLDRLPIGIEQCRFINLTSNEGHSKSKFKAIIPEKRRRICYRIDIDQMNIEVTRGRSEIYDILTHLTFLFIESHKIAKKVLINDEDGTTRAWKRLANVVVNNVEISEEQREILLAHVANIIGRTFEETRDFYLEFETIENPDRLFQIIYWMGKLAIDEKVDQLKRSITFSPVLRERIGQHVYGEIWANSIKKLLHDKNLLGRPLHIISANMHSVLNSIYAPMALADSIVDNDINSIYEMLSEDQNENLRKKVKNYASNNGLFYLEDKSGTNINVQIIDTDKIDLAKSQYSAVGELKAEKRPVIIVMDYAFGEQAYETMDELLKPYICNKNKKYFLDVISISIMGKAGILEGDKGDILIPTAHIFEGTSDNYPVKNTLKKKMFEGCGVEVYSGAMVTVLGTSLQNRDLLQFFYESTWKVIGLEMEGVHYQKAIQAASKIRGNISSKVKVRYAYYASDNPLESGSTLASGGLGTTGVLPTYLITQKILEQII